MLLSLGRGMAPAAAVAPALPADGLLTENGRPLAAQSGALLILDIRISASGMALLSETGDALTTETGDALIGETDEALIGEDPAAMALENGEALIAENDIPLILE